MIIITKEARKIKTIFLERCNKKAFMAYKAIMQASKEEAEKK
jgi:hypothetical protein